PGFDSFEDAADTGDFDPKKDFHTWLTNTPGKTAWPITGATFILLAKDRKDFNVKTIRFFDWAFKNGDAKAKELGYAPLPKPLKEEVRSYWRGGCRLYCHQSLPEQPLYTRVCWKIGSQSL
ncbi:MAG: hypothetical protein K8I29_19875, partial [Alphaproteobacteria bacterium]|nr:hypothetical protein [Candidatus Nitrobium versatile]